MSEGFNFAENERRVLQNWKEWELYNKIVDKNTVGDTFVNLDGPPFVSSDNLHFGHVHIGIMKSFLVNYMNMHGKNVLNKIGYDVHGLPIEQAVSKLLNLSTNRDIREYGLDKYNQKCEDTIKSFSGAWRPVYDRIARFVDFNNEYKTMDSAFMETVWWAWKTLWDKNLVYRGYRIMPYSTACGTSLSASEASGDDVYKEVTDPAIYVKFSLKDHDNTFVVAWTTTPWTLPSNLALAMNPKLKYVKVKDLKTDEFYIVADECIHNVYKQTKTNEAKQYEVVDTYVGADFDNMEYNPVFNYFEKDRTFRIIMAEFVEQGSGTGIVHLAPAFGQDDFDACVNSGVVRVEEVGQFCPIDDNGFVTQAVSDYTGIHVLDTNGKIIERLKQEKKLLKKEMYKHNYPHCWRTDTPLIYKAVSSYFIKVGTIKDRMLVHNEKVNWIPENIGTGRFKQWLENAKDWGVSRSRFFGTPIPVWTSDDGEESVCVGSIDELVQLAGLTERPTNLHPQYINTIQIPSRLGKGMLKLCGDVFDCWFESGCVPFGQLHYPFENSNYFDDKEFLSDFICEGLDQTRGWFYTLTVLSTALLDKPAFKNVICSGLILAEDGKKFSKRLGNFIPPMQVCEQYGSDALRLYLSGSPAAHAESFQFNKEHLKDINAKYYQWYNSLKFLLEHIVKFQKDGHTFDINAYQSSVNVMDNWILSRVRSLLVNVETAMENYTFYKVKPEILEFIEDLTNWYIKFNRNRLRGRFCTLEEQGQAISTLYRVMYSFTLIASPFVPFLTETMYSQLKDYLPETQLRLSVHLCDYPSQNDFPHDMTVERRMKRLQQVAGMVRSLRIKSKNAVSVKVPLKTVTIVNESPEFIDDLKHLERYMCEEINAINIVYTPSCGTTHYKIQLNHKEIGTKYRNKANPIKTKLTELSQDVLVEYLKNSQNGLTLNIDGLDVTVNEPLFSLIKQQELTLTPEIEFSLNERGTTVIIDCTQDPQVMELYAKRLLIVAIQKMRKDAKLKPWNKIGIYYKTDSQLITQVLTSYHNDITQELIYPVYHIDKRDVSEREIVSTDHDINGQKVNVVITDLTNVLP